jgi:two-component sensor histidine kinase
MMSAIPQGTQRFQFAVGDTLLMRELTHRISNDWTSAICAVSLAARGSSDPNIRSALNDVAKQLSCHADLQHVLQIPEDNSEVNAADYLARLCHSLSRSRLEWMNIQLVLAADSVRMEAARCWRLGMVVCELVTNAARHAFNGLKSGVIRVDLCAAGPLGICQVSDNGSAPTSVRRGYGLKIVDELVRSLDGRIEQRFGPFGSTSIFQFYPVMSAVDVGPNNSPVSTATPQEDTGFVQRPEETCKP